MHDHVLHLLRSCVDNFSTIFSGKCLFPGSVHVDSHQREKHRISVWDRLGKPCDGVPSGVKTVKSCDGSGTVYQKQELLNQHKAVHPVLNSELRGSMTGEVTSLGNIQPASWKLERPTRTMHEAQAANNIRRKRHVGEICTDQDALVGCSKKELHCLDFSQNSKRSNVIKEDSKASPNLILGVLDVKQKLRKFELDMSKLRQSKLRWRKMESPIYSHILVSRKADQLAGKSFRALSSRVNKKAIVKMPYSSSSRLQWRILPHQNHQLQPMKSNKIPLHYLERVRLLDFEYAFPNFELVL